jgi:hypothetical protein
VRRFLSRTAPSESGVVVPWPIVVEAEAGEEVTPVLALPSEFHIATVTGWLADLDGRLASPRYANSRLAIDLRQQIREFRSAAPKSQQSDERG